MRTRSSHHRSTMGIPNQFPTMVEYGTLCINHSQNPHGLSRLTSTDPRGSLCHAQLDELGIPVLRLERASSGFILDGPGQVQVRPQHTLCQNAVMLEEASAGEASAHKVCQMR